MCLSSEYVVTLQYSAFSTSPALPCSECPSEMAKLSRAWGPWGQVPESYGWILQAQGPKPEWMVKDSWKVDITEACTMASILCGLTGRFKARTLLKGFSL